MKLAGTLAGGAFIWTLTTVALPCWVALTASMALDCACADTAQPAKAASPSAE